ncbi:MAG: RHS repeat-associated core domain-containing protein, partial [bacterium]|nr:RHS repeat-associated core domain-containing protein [bacterium]
ADGVPAAAEASVATLELLGSQGSYLEGEALAAALGGEHLTAVTALTRAVREGQPLTRVDAGNVDAALATVDLGEDAEVSILAGVGSGKIAWIHQSQLLHETWDASGYVLEDPATGAGGYFVTYERLLTGLDADITFHTPLDLAVVTEPTDVVATIDSEHEIASWTLSTRAADGGEAVVLASGSGTVSAETLAHFDPTLLLNGLYELELTATDVQGQQVSQSIAVSVEGQMKIGHFTLSFVDLAIPVSGLDIEVVRTYDSRDKQLRDFGVGWSQHIRQGSYRNNRPPGDGWQLLTGFLPCDTVVESKSHLTVVRLSDREVYRFAAGLVDGAPTVGGCFARAIFEFVDGPLPGSTLEIIGNDEVFWQDGSNEVIDVDTFERYEPERVRLTTRDGRVFDLDLADGVTGVEDTNGNRLTITPEGISHSSGQSVNFIRDANDRITEIGDLLGAIMTYAYDAAGDLVRFTDRAGGAVRFTYDDHRLIDIEDPRGVTPIRNDYDGDGRLVRHTDAFGKPIEISHDLATRQQIITDRLGASRLLEYDSRGNVVRELDELGDETVRTFDGRDNLLSERDPLGRTTTFTYSSAGELLTQRDPLGKETAYTYNGRGQLLTVTDPRGAVTTRVYDSAGNISSITDALGSVISFTHDAAGNVLTSTDAAGQVSVFEFDSRGNQTKAIDALGNETLRTFDANGNPLTETRTRTLPDSSTETLVTSFTYDSLDRVVTTSVSDGSIAHVSYDLLGKVTSRTDALGRVTAMTYDEMGRLVQTEYPDGTSEYRSHDAESRLTALTDRGGRITSFAYDAAGRFLGATFPDGTTTSHTYDAAGQRITTTDAGNNTTNFTYDAAGRRAAVIDPIGSDVTFFYDENGNQIRVIDARGNSTDFAYDSLNRLTSTTYPDGTTNEIEYDANGRRTAETDQAGLTIVYSYDALGRLTSVTDGIGQVTAYTHDEVGNRLTQTDANGRTTRFEYDRLGRPSARIYPDGARETMAYNVDGTLSSATDLNGNTRFFEYDADRRLTKRVYPDASEVTFTYTSTGQRASVTDSRGTTSYAYDNRDRLIEKVDPNGNTLSYGYDLLGNRTRLTATVGSQAFTTTYGYDPLNRLVAVTDSQGDVTSLIYDENGNRVGLAFPNNVTTSYTYDELNRLTNLATTGNGTVLQSYAYTLGAAGNRIRIDEHDGTARHYTYDGLYRLTEDRVTDSQSAQIYRREFAYDPVGNRIGQIIDQGTGSTVVSSTYDDRDRVLTAAGNSYGWDTNGNLISQDGKNYGWDFENRLTSVILADGTLVENTYDADGNRVQTVVIPTSGPATTVEHLVDTAGRLSPIDIDLGAAKTQQFVRTGSLSHVVADVIGGLVRTLYTRAGDQLIGMYRTDSMASRYYHADGLGSVRLLSNEAGEVTDRYSYTAFGELLDNAGTDINPYRFAGEPFDLDVGLSYNRARWLDVGTGRFISVDPFAGRSRDPLSIHRYLYAHLNPTFATDPTGWETLATQNTASAMQTSLNAISWVRTQTSIVVTSSTALVAGGMNFLLYRGNGFIALLRNTGTYGIKAYQRIRRSSNHVVTRAEALGTKTWGTYKQMRPAINRIYRTGSRANPADIEHHHLVEQQALQHLGNDAATERAINSIANVFPTSAHIHSLISNFYSSGSPVLRARGFSSFRAWLADYANGSWEVHYRVGMEIWQRAMTTGVAGYTLPM